MVMGRHNAGKKMKAVYGNRDEIIELNAAGEGVFPVGEMSASVWIYADAII